MKKIFTLICLSIFAVISTGCIGDKTAELPSEQVGLKSRCCSECLNAAEQNPQIDMPTEATSCRQYSEISEECRDFFEKNPMVVGQCADNPSDLRIEG